MKLIPIIFRQQITTVVQDYDCKRIAFLQTMIYKTGSGRGNKEFIDRRGNLYLNRTEWQIVITEEEVWDIIQKLCEFVLNKIFANLNRFRKQICYFLCLIFEYIHVLTVNAKLTLITLSACRTSSRNTSRSRQR